MLAPGAQNWYHRIHESFVVSGLMNSFTPVPPASVSAKPIFIIMTCFFARCADFDDG